MAWNQPEPRAVPSAAPGARSRGEWLRLKGAGSQLQPELRLEVQLLWLVLPLCSSSQAQQDDGVAERGRGCARTASRVSFHPLCGSGRSWGPQSLTVDSELRAGVTSSSQPHLFPDQELKLREKPWTLAHQSRTPKLALLSRLWDNTSQSYPGCVPLGSRKQGHSQVSGRLGERVSRGGLASPAARKQVKVGAELEAGASVRFHLWREES